jgi:hypothetical protein
MRIAAKREGRVEFTRSSLGGACVSMWLPSLPERESSARPLTAQYPITSLWTTSWRYLEPLVSAADAAGVLTNRAWTAARQVARQNWARARASRVA